MAYIGDGDDKAGESYKDQGMLWEVLDGPSKRYIGHASCTRCHMPIDQKSGNCTDPECSKKYRFKEGYQASRGLAAQRYQASLRKKNLITVSSTNPATLISEDENEKYFLEARLVQKGTNETVVVTLGEKNKDQGDTDKLQFFLDITNQQVRHDPSNARPADIASSYTAKFDDGTELNGKFN